MTPWESRLWYQFLRGYPLRFQRQKAIGNFIVDFYCARARLVVELDGSGHYEPEQASEDRARTASLESMNLSVIRFTNAEVDQCFSAVCQAIHRAVEARIPPSDEGGAERSEAEGEI